MFRRNNSSNSGTSNRKPKHSQQLGLLAKMPLSYGGELLKKRKYRMHGRTLDTKSTMHLVLRSTKATGAWSFSKPTNKSRIAAYFRKFSAKYGVRIYSIAYVGNHIHAQIKLSNRHSYRPFIRALTAAIAMAITGASRWTPKKIKFWDYRPFTRIVRGYRAFLTLKDYIQINRYEGFGYARNEARFLVEWNRNARGSPP